MPILPQPALADPRAAAVALATLGGGARRRFETQARLDPALRALAYTWQERFAAMTELQPGLQPSPNVWKRIQLELDRERLANAPQTALARPGGRWRWLAGAGALATMAAVAVSVGLYNEVRERDATLAQAQGERSALAQRNAQLVAQVQASPEIRYVAVLSDDKSAPSVLVTFDPKHNTLTLRRVGDFREDETRSLQLWALPPGATPRSLGVLPPDGVVRLTAAESQVQAPALAISLEPKGGVPGDQGPTGPVLFKGALLPTS
jgi:anti-sigma-K factor RskA